MKKTREYLDNVDHDILQMAKPDAKIEYTWYLMRQADGGLNSYERQFLYEMLDAEGVVRETKLLQEQITMYAHDQNHRPRSTYEEVLLMVMLPMLVDRLMEAEQLVSLCLTFRDHESKSDEEQQKDYKHHIVRRLELLKGIFNTAERVK